MAEIYQLPENGNGGNATIPFSIPIGFGGCQMSWRTPDGSNIYDKMSFVNIANAIASDDKTSEDWQSIRDTARKKFNEFPSTAVQRFAVSEAELEEVDFSKPTTIILHMGGNDLASSEIGDLWNWADELTDYDKTSIMGAFNYGVHKILTAYPHIRFIVCLNRWTTYDNGSTPDYAYEKKQQWLAALKQNCERMGISCCDVHNALGSNKWNKDYYQIDWTHQNGKGYVKMAKMLAAIDKSWLM